MSSAIAMAMSRFSAKVPPKVTAMLASAPFSFVMPVSFIQALLNSGPYQIPPSANDETVATTTASQLMSAK